MLFKVFSLNTILLSVAAPIDKIASAKQGLVAEQFAAHAACSGLEDNWPKDRWESWASSATDACEQWTLDSKTGALQDGRTVAMSCTLAFAQANCAQTCCTKAGTTPIQVATMATAPEALMMQKIIDAAFKDVPDTKNEYFPIPPELQKMTSWTQCSQINYSPECLKRDGSLLCKDSSQQTVKALTFLGVYPHCMPNGTMADTSTCKSCAWSTASRTRSL